MRSTTVVVLAAFVVSVMHDASVAHADDIGRPSSAEAIEHLKKGNRLYRVREFEKAIEEYKAGAVKEDAPIFSYNLAQSYRQLGRYEEAIWHYKLFLKRATPPDEMKEGIAGFIKQMTDEQAKRAMTQPPVEPAPDPKPTSPPPLAMTQPTPTVKDRERWYEDRLGWGATGAGAIGVGVSLGLFITANALDDDGKASMEQSEREALYARAHDRRVVATIVGVAAGAVVAAGVVKLVMHPKDDGPQRTSLQMGFSHRGIALVGRF